MEQRGWTKKELVLWGLGMCGGTKEFVDTETVGVLLFQRHPGIFGLRNHPQYPDIDVARVQLADAKRDKGPDDPVRVIQDTDERKRRARLRGSEKRILSRDPKWKLNDEGFRWYQENRDAIQRYISSVAQVGERRGRGAIHVSPQQISIAVSERIHKRKSFAAFSRDPDAHYTEKDLPILDFFAVFNVDAHTPEPLFQAARARTMEALKEDSVETRYATALSELYGHRYRSYYDELLAAEEQR